MFRPQVVGLPSPGNLSDDPPSRREQTRLFDWTGRCRQTCLSLKRQRHRGGAMSRMVMMMWCAHHMAMALKPPSQKRPFHQHCSLRLPLRCRKSRQLLRVACESSPTRRRGLILSPELDLLNTTSKQSNFAFRFSILQHVPTKAKECSQHCYSWGFLLNNLLVGCHDFWREGKRRCVFLCLVSVYKLLTVN